MPALSASCIHIVHALLLAIMWCIASCYYVVRCVAIMQQHMHDLSPGSCRAESRSTTEVLNYSIMQDTIHSPEMNCALSDLAFGLWLALPR